MKQSDGEIVGMIFTGRAKQDVQEEIRAGDIHFITEETLDPAGYALKAGSGKEKGQTDAALYRVARTYISFIRQISRKESE